MDTYILHLETATKVCSSALSKNGLLVAIKETSEDGYVHGEYLNLFIDEILKETGIDTSALSAVSIASGPGSYTGLRIGSATAKALCYAHNIPLIAIGTLHSLIQMGRKKYQHETLCAAVDARRMEVYSLIMDAQGVILKDLSADVLEPLSYSEFDPFVCIGDGAAKLDELWKGRSCKIDGTVLSSAAGQVELAYDKFNKKEFENVAYWEPFYLKDFIAGKKTN